MQDNTRYDYSAIISRPPLKWPNDARVAFWVIPNIEHFKVNVPLPGAPNLIPDVRNAAGRDYGPRVGIWRLMEALDKYGVRGTVALNAEVCQQYPIIIEEAKKRDWAFMGHGMTNSQRLTAMDEAEERAIIRETIRIMKEHVGRAPIGWLGPGLTETFSTPDLLAAEGVQYLCDWCADDQPFPLNVRSGKMISVPYSIELNDLPFFGGKSTPAEEFYQMCVDQFDVLYREGEQSGRVMAIALHPFVIGHPFRIKYLEKALEYITGHDKVWVTTGDEIAQWYMDHYQG